MGTVVLGAMRGYTLVGKESGVPVEWRVCW